MTRLYYRLQFVVSHDHQQASVAYCHPCTDQHSVQACLEVQVGSRIQHRCLFDYDDDDDAREFVTPQNEIESNNFAVLNSSLPEQLPEQHHLTSYANAKYSRSMPMVKEKKQHRTKWHFGIR